VLIAVLQHHQRYFALEDNAGNLLPRFITISNIDSPMPALIRAGNERVVRRAWPMPNSSGSWIAGSRSQRG